MRFMDLVGQKLAEMEYADNTRRLYARWIVRYIVFQGKRHPASLGVKEIEAFLGHLALKRKMSAAAINQALGALMFLYGCLLDLPEVAKAAARLRSRGPQTLPETASKAEIETVLARLQPKCRLMAYLCYGAGLAVGECVRLRLSDVDTERMVLTVSGRETILPQRALQPILDQAALAVVWPGNVDRYLFPSSRLHGGRCFFVSESSLQKAMKEAVRECGLARRVTPKVLRHSFVRHLLRTGHDTRTVQTVAGFADVKSVMTYQKMEDVQGVTSPMDTLENIRKK